MRISLLCCISVLCFSTSLLGDSSEVIHLNALASDNVTFSDHVTVGDNVVVADNIISGVKFLRSDVIGPRLSLGDLCLVVEPYVFSQKGRSFIQKFLEDPDRYNYYCAYAYKLYDRDAMSADQIREDFLRFEAKNDRSKLLIVQSILSDYSYFIQDADFSAIKRIHPDDLAVINNPENLSDLKQNAQSLMFLFHSLSDKDYIIADQLEKGFASK